MEEGYTVANRSLSWIESEKFESFAFADEDLANVSFKNLFPFQWKQWKGEYFKAAHCRSCQIILIDYAEKYDRKAVNSQI